MAKFKDVDDGGGLGRQGIDDAALQKQINDLKDQIGNNLNQTILGETPEPCSPSYIIAYQKAKKGKLRGRGCVSCSPGTIRLKTVIIRAADRTDSATFDDNLIPFSYELDADQINSGHVEYPTVLLDAETQYDLVKLVAIDDNNGRLITPSTEPAYNTAPITQFTTPAAFGAPSAPDASLIIANALDSSTRAFDAYTTVRILAPLTDASAAQTFRQAQQGRVQAIFTDPDSQTLRIDTVLTDAELDQVWAGSTPTNRGYVDVTLKPEIPGLTYHWVRNLGWTAGNKAQSANTNIAYVAGGSYGVDPTTLTSLSLSIITNVDPYTPKFGRVDLNFTQPATIVALKNVTLERRLTTEVDADYVVVAKKETLKDDEWWTVGAHVKALVEGMGFKPSKTYRLRCTIHAIGGATKQFTQDVTTGTNPDVAMDTAAPTLATNPDVATTGPTVRERHSKLKCFAYPPSANFNTIDLYQFILSTQNTAPAGDPTVGSEGVLEINNADSGFAVFHIPYSINLTTGDVYVYFRAHNQFNSGTYSVWSAGTNQHGYSRPLQDFIGSGVPTLPMALERTTTSGSGHASSTFVLDSGASSVDDFYNNMVLHWPAAASASDRVRNITDYVGSTRTCTLDTAWGSTPVGAQTYEIDRGLTRAGKSGTGHGTTTFVLDSSASAVNDFYNGMMLYIPSATAGQQIQRIIDYVGATKTCSIEAIESALSGAPANNCGYMISQGGFGYAASDGTGVIAPTPLRIWYNSDAALNSAEIINPSGENAFSLTHFQMQAIRKDTGATRFDETLPMASATSYPFPLKSFTLMLRIRFRNLYRESGSDGWSDRSYYTPSPVSGAIPTTTQNPGLYPPIEVDFEDDANYPTSRFLA